MLNEQTQNKSLNCLTAHNIYDTIVCNYYVHTTKL